MSFWRGFRVGRNTGNKTNKNFEDQLGNEGLFALSVQIIKKSQFPRKITIKRAYHD